ncbi:MAG: hypothetical protein HOD11_06650, partial [Candidatus Marinimicrobia bacterium]|nr:hypothetical protein [Candidatus Neomarinimicrobiota bacterium]
MDTSEGLAQKVGFEKHSSIDVFVRQLPVAKETIQIEVVPQEEVVKKESAGKKLIGKFKKKEKEEEYTEAGLQGGQIVSQVDNREKYMKTTLPNPKLLP